MDYIKAFFIGIIESFINVIPTSFSGHEKIYFYTNSYISGDNHDTLIPFIVKIACLIAIIYYFRKMYKDILGNNYVKLAFHLHTTLTDGQKTPEEVAKR